MKLRRWSLRAPRAAGGYAVALGAFDGLHVGHQALIARALAAARAQGLAGGVLSFEPLPREFLNAQAPPPRLTSLRERWHVLRLLGLEHLHLLRFDAALAGLSPADFVQLLARGGARHVVVGHDFRFGHRGAGDARLLAAAGPDAGFGVEVLEPVLSGGVRVGSSLVRSALAAGDFVTAQRLLGRAYTMCGRVRRGAQLGRTLGFPTANLPVQRRHAPLCGIFAVRARTIDGRAPRLRWTPAVASLGTRPQVGGVEPLLEVHLFDFSGDLYGRELEVEFVAKLRDERKFASLEAMTEQMHGDAALARRILAEG